MNKIIPKLTQAGLMAMMGYEVGQSHHEPVIVKVDTHGNSKENTVPVDDSKDFFIAVIFLLVILIIVVLAALFCSFKSKPKRTNVMEM